MLNLRGLVGLAMAGALCAAAPAAAPAAPAQSAAAPAASAPAASAPATPATPAPAAAPALSAASVSSAESPAEAPPSTETVLLQLSDRLTDEAERQHQVDQRMDLVVDRLRAMVEDLDSNGLVRQGGGPAMDRLGQILKILGTRNVPDAAKYLEEARRQLAALKPNLVAADKEIDIIVLELEKILSRGSGVGEDLLRELEVIIQDEKRTGKDTKEWGVQLLQQPQTAEKAGREIAARQDTVARRTERFMERLAKARDAETDPARHLGMQKAHEVMDRAKVTKLLGGAAQDIQDKKPVAATQSQQDAIAAMEEAADYLRSQDASADLQALKELRDKLENILKQQTALREKTESVPAEKFPNEKNDLQVQQRAIDKDLQAAAREIPPAASPEVKSNVNAADRHMQQAEKQIAQTQQQPGAESQKKAENALQNAIKALDQDIASAEQQWQQQNQPMQTLASIAQQAMELAQKQLDLKAETGQTQQQVLPQLTPAQNNLQQQAQALQQQAPLPQFQQAAQVMQQASQSLQQSQQQPAMQQQQAAADALMQAAQAIQQAQQAMALAAQQAALMAQTGATPQGALPQLAPPQQSLQQQTQAAQFQQAAQEMGQASQSLQQSQQGQAMQSQQAAIDSLMGAAAQAMGMQPGQMPGMAMAPGMAPGMMPAPGPAIPNVPAVDPMDIGSRDFGRGGAAGPRKASGDDHWKPLGDRERDTLYQKYAQQLPPEYRELLGDYYEALSKDLLRAARRNAPAAPAAPAPPGLAKPEAKP